MDRGYQITVLAPRDEYTDRIVAQGVSYRPMRMEGKGKNPFSELATFFGFIRAYHTLAPEIVLQYTIKPNLYGSLAARLLGIPVVNNVTGLGEAFTSGGLTEFLARLLYRLAFAKAAIIFFQNPDDQALFLQGGLVRQEQTHLLPGSGVDTTRFAPLPRMEGAFTFLQVGRLLHAKGAEDFIRAAQIIKQDNPEIRFALLGRYDPDDSNGIDPDFFEAARTAGTIEYWGECDDVRPQIAKADCVVLPSYYREGTPRSLLEAASMAKPLVAADSPGTREPIISGLNGYLHTPRDPRDLAQKLSKILGLDKAELAAMGAASRILMKERFEEKIVIEAYLNAVNRFRKSGRIGNK